jgi:hypothetical protein
MKIEKISKFDVGLGGIKHFELHAEYLPYVGHFYDQFRILLIGESHYLKKYYGEQTDFLEGWYEKYTHQFQWNDESDTSWFNTRGVVNDFRVRNHLKGYIIFRKPSKIIRECIYENYGIELSDFDAYRCCSFLNYYQRPELKTGESIANNHEDDINAAETLKRVIEILKPIQVIFLSKKAFESYHRLNSSDYSYFYHPNSKYWGKGIVQGEEGFKQLINEYIMTLPNISAIITLKSMVESRNRIFNEVFEYITCTIKRYDHFRIVLTEKPQHFPRLNNNTNYECNAAFSIGEATYLFFTYIDNFYKIVYGICGWDSRNCTISVPSYDQRHFINNRLNPFNVTKRRKSEYCWYDTIKNGNNDIDFTNNNFLEQDLVEEEIQIIRNAIDEITLNISREIEKYK